jgi:hypothetical protein
MTVFHPLSGCIVFYDIDISYFLFHLSIYGHFHYSHFLVIVDSAAIKINIVLQTSLQHIDFISFGYKPRNGVVG